MKSLLKLLAMSTLVVLAIALFAPRPPSVYVGPEYGHAAVPGVVMNDGTRFTIPAYRARIDRYIGADYNYYYICVDHLFHLWDIERNLASRFDTQAERDNALVVIGLYEQACREWKGPR